jgi:hypothetical protein
MLISLTNIITISISYTFQDRISEAVVMVVVVVVNKLITNL